MMKDAYSRSVSEYCAQIVFDHGDLLNSECIQLFVSVMLSYAIVLGSVSLKVPQIIQIVRAKSGAGISKEMYLLDICVFTLTVSYFFTKQYPFSSFGDSLFILIQNLIVYYLLFFYEKKISIYFGLGSALYFVILAVCLSGAVPMEKLYSLTIPIAILSRVPQIYKSYSESSVGNLNLITFFLNFIGSGARIYTTLILLGDPLVLIGYCCTTLLNGIVTLQIIYYNYIQKKKAE